ncbi:MAG TPA: DUF5320 domain-containing protein [Acidobacteriota bacterium]|nr:DUF5320 domain-containing protein [Acidobacteriota bacterium]
MPRGDRTGPLGQGPMSGRGAGYCAGAPVPGYANPAWGGFGRGGGLGRGGGRGQRHRNWYYATGLPGWARNRGGAPLGMPYVPPTMPSEAPDEAVILKQQADYHESVLKDIRQRLAGLETADTTEKS